MSQFQFWSSVILSNIFDRQDSKHYFKHWIHKLIILKKKQKAYLLTSPLQEGGVVYLLTSSSLNTRPTKIKYFIVLQQYIQPI